MAKPYSPINLRSIDVQFDKMAKEMKGKMAETLAETARTCLLNVINPDGIDPFKTGSYISSHRVGVNKVDTSDTVIYQEGIRTKEVAKGRAYLELKKIKNIKPEDTITISNSVGYSTKYGYSWARNVEYVGWKNKGPYLIYEKAVAKTMAALPKIAATIMDKQVLV